MGATYLVTGLVGGALLNLWEEAAWAGFVQHRLMDRHGFLVGSLLTTVPFALIHVPGVFQNTPAPVAAFHVAVVAVVAPFLRYLVGAVFIDTGGSILAVAVLHASFNAIGTSRIRSTDDELRDRIDALRNLGRSCQPGRIP